MVLVCGDKNVRKFLPVLTGGSASETLSRPGSPGGVRGHQGAFPHPPGNASCWLGAFSWSSLGLPSFEMFAFNIVKFLWFVYGKLGLATSAKESHFPPPRKDIVEE